MKLFGTLHLSILAIIAALASLLILLRRADIIPAKAARWMLGLALAANEVVWWAYRYSREGFHVENLPLQLCDAAVWFTVLACFIDARAIVEFAYFAGIAGAGMALLTPNLISPWPSYPAVYFFIAHGGIVVTMLAVVPGSRTTIASAGVWRSYALLLVYAAFVGLVDRMSGANFMFLLHKPEAASLLDAMGPWPWYLLGGALLGLALFWLLWLPVRRTGPTN
jgi:hypothetical integral membrane protein (TIGR02206 family)